MKTQAKAFLIRSLRQESRLIGHHLIRVTLATLVLVVLASGVYTYGIRSRVGAVFASTVMSSLYWFVTLLGAVYFSTAIVEEKEERTLPLLRMTGATPFSILIGKSLPRLIAVILLLLVTAPFIFLSVTLGGVEFRGLLTAILGILAYSVMMSQLGLLSSVISTDGQRATSKTLAMWFFLEFVSVWTWFGQMATLAIGDFKNTADAASYLQGRGTSPQSWSLDLAAWLHVNLNWLMGWSEPFVLRKNLDIYTAGLKSMPIWQPQMTAHLLIALTMFCLSWLLFEPCTAKVVGEGQDEPKRRFRSAIMRPWKDALFWKSWQHLTGGWVWLWIRLIGIPVFIVSLCMLVAFAIDENLEMPMVAGILLFVGVVTMIAHLAILFSRLFTNEIKDKTLGSLMMLPISRNALLTRSAAGLLPAIIASMSSFIIGLSLLLFVTSPSIRQMNRVVTSPWFYQSFTLTLTAVYVGVYLSIRMRYGGMLLAFVGFLILGPIGVSLTISIMATSIGWSAANEFGQTILPIGLFIIEVPVCILAHWRILRGLERVAEQG